MKKRLLAILLFLPLAILSFAAQLTATLQSGDKVTPFYGTNAFVEAYEAADDGDIITLSVGEFTPTDIKKSITVIGSGMWETDPSKSTIFGSPFSIFADDVTLEGVRVNKNLSIKGANNLSISRSYLYQITDEEVGERKYHDNTVITDSVIDTYGAMSLSNNAIFKNCCINCFTSINESIYPALIENCNITCFSWENKSSVDIQQPYAIYRNCYLGLFNRGESTLTPHLSLYSPSEFHNIIFFTNYYFSSGSSSSKPYSINYGSCVKENVFVDGQKFNVSSSIASLNFYNTIGQYNYTDTDPEKSLTVGTIDFKKDPSIPEILSSEIDTETDAEGMLHVKISASARD